MRPSKFGCKFFFNFRHFYPPWRIKNVSLVSAVVQVVFEIVQSRQDYVINRRWSWYSVWNVSIETNFTRVIDFPFSDIRKVLR